MNLIVMDKTVICSLAALFFLLLPALALSAESGAARGKRIMLVGASVGQEWDFSGVSRRTNRDDLATESIAVYQFDKTAAIDEVLMRPKRKFRLTKSYFTGFLTASPQPVDTVIIKECAAYFPGDLESYKRSVQKWAATVRDARKEVVLATVVPVTEKHSRTHPGRLESILKFNDWVRDYARGANLPVLDLEAAVRTGKDRFLRDDFTSGDGLHLNKKAYEALDRLVAERFAGPGRAR